MQGSDKMVKGSCKGACYEEFSFLRHVGPLLE